MRAAKLSAAELSAQGKRAAAIRWEKSKLLKEEPVVRLAPPDSTKPEAVFSAITSPYSDQRVPEYRITAAQMANWSQII